MTSKEYERLRDRFRKVFDLKWDPAELDNFDELREKFAFHMTDMASHFTALANAYSDSAECDSKCLADHAEMFFYHCMPHLVAAGQIYDEIPQLFEEQQGVHDWNSFVDDPTVP